MIEDNLIILLFAFAATGVVQYALVRQRVASIADPLLFFVVTSAFSLALGCLAVDDSWLLVRLFVYFACFYAGFLLASGPSQRLLPPLQMHGDIQHFRAIVIVCGLVYLGFNTFMWMKSGVILLSDDPSLQKSEAYAEGYGLIRRYNWSVGVFVLIASLYWWLWERTALAVLFVTVSVLIAITGGGKSALLPAIFAVGLFIANPFVSAQLRNDAPRLRRIIPILLCFASIPVAIILITEHGTVKDALDAFVVRLFSFGDVLLYWGQETVRSEFAGLGPVDYLRDTFGSVLGALRLTDYGIPIGNQFVRSTLPVGTDFSESLGPNLLFYVRGELYFGAVFAPLHAFIIGVIFGYLRRLFVTYRGHGLLTYSLLSFAVVLSLTLPTEEGLAVGQAFDFVIFFLPIYALTSYFSTSIRRITVSNSMSEEM